VNLKTCLLIEDDPHEQDIFVEALESAAQNVTCYWVGNGEEALFSLLKEGFMPDYIFTDLMMPRMNGFEFIKIIKGLEKFKHIPVVVYSSGYTDDIYKMVKSLGAQEFYRKADVSSLKDVLHEFFSTSSNSPTVL
jgi:CheY-like chemotaxis protein